MAGNAVAESDSGSEGGDDDDRRSGNGSDDQFYIPSSDTDDSSSSSGGMFEEIEVLGTHGRGKATVGIHAFVDPSFENHQMETGLIDGHQSGAQPPRAAQIDFLDFLGSKRKKYRNYIPRKRRDDESTGELTQWKIWEKEHERWIDENMKKDLDSDHHDGFVKETADAPSELIVPLLQYQKEWLAWALKQEESTTRGGILVDEMGMGKTIQAVALVLAKREIHRKINQLSGPFPLSGSSDVSSRLKETLVECPVVVVTQWVSEIHRFTTKGSSKVLVYHGANREYGSKQFSDYDFVIKTYSTVEAEFRKYVMPAKKKCAYCGKSFYKKKLPIHLKYYCGPNASRTAKQSKQYGKKLKTTPLTSDLKTESDKDKTSHTEISELQLCLLKRKSALHSVTWDRIISDEAHSIKARHSNTGKAIFALESSYKWALTGTPLQNCVGELYSLVHFLQIVPYSYYLCKDCNCRTLDYRSLTKWSSCPHSSVRHFCRWNKYISNPIQAYGNDDLGRRAMILLKEKVLKNIVLRRTKKGRAADLALPPRTVVLRQDTLDVKEEDYYESLQNESQAQFNTYVKAGTVLDNYAHIFQLLTCLRQAVNHPYLVVYSKTAALKGGNMVNAYNVEQVCSICHEPAEDPVVTSCAHVFCKACLLDFSASTEQVSCPTCSRLLATDLTANSESGDETAGIGFKSSSILNRIQLNNFQTNTKIEALVCVI